MYYILYKNIIYTYIYINKENKINMSPNLPTMENAITF